MSATVARWIAFGVAGLAFAVGVGLGAATIASERIGLSSEPLTAGRDLAPARVDRPVGPRKRPKPPTRTTPEPAPAPAPDPVAPAPDDHGGSSGPSEQSERESEPDDDD